LRTVGSEEEIARHDIVPVRKRLGLDRHRVAYCRLGRASAAIDLRSHRRDHGSHPVIGEERTSGHTLFPPFWIGLLYIGGARSYMACRHSSNTLSLVSFLPDPHHAQTSE
jgi:hypothetical protein